MNKTTPQDTYLDPYREAHDDHGSGFEVTLWANPRSQIRRFKVFTEMAFLAGKRILDAGCSRGDFASYLLEKDIAYRKFIGVDGLCDVINYAKQRRLPRAEFHCGDFLNHPEILRTGRPHIIVISGTLNTMDPPQVFRSLNACWDAAGEALLFNFLSDRTGPGAPPQLHPARRLDTMQLLDWAFQRTWDVQFRQDYFKHGHDATILMRKHE